MDNNYTWVKTHKGIVQYLSDKENSQQELIDLLKNPKYKNVELIPESTTVDYDEWYTSDTEALKDPARKKLTVYEYWGNWDINGDGTKVPIVATWVNNIMLRLEENPYPDHKPEPRRSAR